MRSRSFAPQDVWAILAVNRGATPAGDVPDDFITGHRVAAAGKSGENIAQTQNRNRVFRDVFGLRGGFDFEKVFLVSFSLRECIDDVTERNIATADGHIEIIQGAEIKRFDQSRQGQYFVIPRGAIPDPGFLFPGKGFVPGFGV